MEEVAGTLQEVLQYMGTSQDDLGHLSRSLVELVSSADALLQTVRRQPEDAGECTASAPAYFHNRLPNFISSNLKALQIAKDGHVSCNKAEQEGGRLEQLLQEDLALLRHVTDFVGDIAKWSGTEDQCVPFDEHFSLYPACDIEHEQAFWKSHQEQVRDCRS